MTLAMMASVASACAGPARSPAPELKALDAIPVLEEGRVLPRPPGARVLGRVTARACRHQRDPAAQKRDLLAALRAQAYARSAVAVVLVRYKPVVYGNRGFCRPGLEAVGVLVGADTAPGHAP